MRATNDPRPSTTSFLRQLLQVFLTLSLVIGLVAPVILFLTSWHQTRNFSERTAHEIAAVFAGDVRYALLVGSAADAHAVVSNILKFPEVLRAEVVDERGTRLAVGTARDLAAARRTFAIEQVVTAESHGAPSTLAEGQRTPIDLGRIRMTVSLDRAYRTCFDAALYAAVQLVAVTLLLSLALIRVSRKMLAPLAALVQSLRSNASDASLPAVPACSPSEVHFLYRAIDAMRRRIADDNQRLVRYTTGLETMVAERTRALEAARDQAERANRAKTLFLANVSHELRTPLQAIILQARLISGGTGQDSVRGSPSTILSASSHLLELIEQLLDLSKAESDHGLELSYSTFGLRDLVHEAASTIRATLAPGNTLTVHCCGDPGAIVSDRTRLLQVMYNLLRNADKFTTNGHITLTLDGTNDPDRVRLTITDDGIGIPQEQIDRIFEPFFQGTSAHGTVSRGIGIGLWVTKTIVDALGGCIDVSSTPGAGAAFRVEIPRVPNLLAARTAPQGPDAEQNTVAVGQPSSRGIRVLFGEDEAVIREAMSLFLRDASWTNARTVSRCWRCFSRTRADTMW
jgi:signal transduction histidine kinase